MSLGDKDKLSKCSKVVNFVKFSQTVFRMESRTHAQMDSLNA